MMTFTGREYLMIAIANAFGLDKESWANRINWTQDNYRVLEAFDEEADEPVFFRKYVRALRKADKGEPIGTPIGLDATASGLQMMAAMSGCRQTAAAVNLLNTGKREDAYTRFGQSMNQKLKRDVSRADLKQAIMTFFYGSTKVPETVFGRRSEALKAFYESMEESLPGAYELMQLFQAQWNPNAEFYQWVMPDGFTVRIPVLETVKKKIEVDDLDHATFMYQTSVVKPQKKGLSLAANITHSVDGYVLREMVRMAADQGVQVACVHDCFYAHPNHMNLIRQNYLLIMGQVAQGDFVNGILNQFAVKPVNYRPASTDLWKEILQAEYAIC